MKLSGGLKVFWEQRGEEKNGFVPQRNVRESKLLIDTCRDSPSDGYIRVGRWYK